VHAQKNPASAFHTDGIVDFLAPQAVQLSNQFEEDMAKIYGLRGFFKWREEIPNLPKTLASKEHSPLVVLNP
jgi:hypothetical protein